MYESGEDNQGGNFKSLIFLHSDSIKGGEYSPPLINLFVCLEGFSVTFKV